MADKKKNASRSQMVSPSAARSEEKEQSKSVKAMARERDERKERDNKSGSSRSSSKQSAASARVTRFRNNRLVRFVRDAYYELRYKVTWPTFEEARNMTFVVIGLSAAVGILLGLADFGLTRLFFLITGRQ